MGKTVLIIFLSALSIGYGQSNFQVDSLKAAIENPAATDSLKIDAYSNLFDFYKFKNEDSARFYVQALYTFSKKNQNNFGLSQYHYSRGFFHHKTAQYDSVVGCLNKSLYFADKLQNKKLQAKLHLRLGGAFSRLGKPDSALIHNKIAIQLAKSSKNHVHLALGLLEMGNIYIYSNRYDKALAKYQAVDSILSIHDPTNPNLGYALSNIGLIYVELDKPQKALPYFERAKAMHKKSGFLEGLASSNQEIGKIYHQLNDYEKAIDYYNQALAYYNESGNSFMLAQNYVLLGETFLELKQADEAITNFQNALLLNSDGKNSIVLAQNYVLLGKAYLAKKDYTKSIYFSRKAINAGQGAQDIDARMNAQWMLSEAYSKAGKSDSAYAALSHYVVLKDSLTSLRNIENIQKLETQYQTEKKEQHIELLESQQALTLQEKKNQRNLLLGGLGLTTLAGLFFFFMYRNRQKTNEKLEELSRAKSIFFANISHEFRSPITIIKGIVGDGLSLNGLSTAQRKHLLAAQRNTFRLETLVEQLLALAKLEGKNMRLHVQPGNLSNFLRAQAETFSFSAQEKHLEISLEIPKNENMHWFDHDTLEKISANLIGNAIKYTPVNGQIIILGAQIGDTFVCKIQNSGSYLDPEQQERIFDRFYQVNSQNPGTGIGLALAKELTQLHHGTLTIQSIKDNFTTFTLKIPISKNEYISSEILTEELQHSDEQIPLNLEETLKINQDILESAPLLLVVDDNSDIRNYIASVFESNYAIYQAADGKEGFKIALEVVPDIIISDVIMPHEDGFTLTKNLKENNITSHIPVILLTAKSEITDKVEGMDIGADAYVTKPFSATLLKANVDNLIENRRKLRARYSQEVVLMPKDMSDASPEKHFWERLEKILEVNLIEPNFSIEKFASEMAMSRMQLHRKLKALTGQNPSDFLRSQRLKMAVVLLKKNKMPISEIGYAVGFNNPSYFSKAFKQEFGHSPSDYLSSDSK